MSDPAGDALVLPGPDSLTEGAGRVIASVSRDELVNLLIDDLILRTEDRATEIAEQTRVVYEKVKVLTMELYLSVYSAVRAQLDVKIAPLTAAIEALCPGSNLTLSNVIEPEFVTATDYGLATSTARFRRDDYRDQPPGLPDVVAVEIAKQAGIFTPNPDCVGEKWIARICYTTPPPPDKGVPHYHEFQIPTPVTVHVSADLIAARQRLIELVAEQATLRSSVAESALPALRRRALAALTRNSLSSQGVSFDSARLLAGMVPALPVASPGPTP
jgi:hypothetical protein